MTVRDTRHADVRLTGDTLARKRLARTPRPARGSRESPARPTRGPSSAPRSIAGTARSSSGPSARPVSATRIGWNSAFPFCPVRAFTSFADGPEALAIEPRRLGELLGQRRAHLARGLGSHLLLRGGRFQRAVGVVVEQKREPRRHLIEPIDRRRSQSASPTARNSRPWRVRRHRDAGAARRTAPTARRAASGRAIFR